MADEDFMMPCLTKKYLGFDCLGCGTQRAIFLLLEGNFIDAWKMYPAIYTLIFLVIFVLLALVDKKRKYGKIIIFLAIFNAIVVLISYFFKQYHLYLQQ